MKHIKVINDNDFNLETIELSNPRIRISARGLVFNDDNKIAILNKNKKNEYKLVGGGVEDNENPKSTFEREVLEESGCRVKIDDFIGIIKEERTHYNFIQISYIYIAHVIEDTKHLNLTEKEKEEGAQLLWLTIDEATKLIKSGESNIKGYKYEYSYPARFAIKRDYTIVEYYKNNYKKNNNSK